jgi:hypothetical protein
MKAKVALILVPTAVAGWWASVGYSQSGKDMKGPGFANVAQEPGSAIHDQEQSSPIPGLQVEFKPQGTIPGVAASPALSLPILCSPDGTPFISVPEPPAYTTQTVYSLDPNGAHSFSYQSAVGLYNVYFRSFFPGDSVVGLLVNATNSSKQSTYTIESQGGTAVKSGTAFRGERHDYIVQFDRNGNYKSTVELPSEYSFHRIAELSDGNLLALVYDSVNAVARLLLLDPDGKPIRRLDIPGRMEDSPALRQGETGGDLNQGRAETSLSWWLFAPVRQKVVLYIAHSTAPVLEIGAGGAAREVSLQAPDGYEIDGFISATDRWIVRFRLKDLSGYGENGGRSEARNYALYEVNPSDGSLKTELETSSVPAFGIACESGGTLTGFSMTSDSKYLRATSEISR